MCRINFHGKTNFTLYTFKKSIYYDVILNSNILDNSDAPDTVYDGL